MKTATTFLDEAHAVVPKISAEDGIAKHASGNATFIDVRDGTEIAASGTIAGALRIPRGMIEFRADSGHDMHNAALSKDADIVLICGAGGQAALTGKTMKDMGYTNVSNVGGFSGWKDAGGPTED